MPFPVSGKLSKKITSKYTTMAHPEKTITGLFFGSFNPVHTGHLIIANHFIQYTDIEEVWFVITPQNPHKPKNQMLDEKERLDLLKLAIGNNPCFFPCDVEFSMKKPSYSVYTIKKLQKDYPGRIFKLLIGSDNLQFFDTWKDHKEIIALLDIQVYPRTVEKESPFLSHPAVSMVSAPLIEISSSAIRSAIAAGKEPRYMLPDAVLDRIIQGGFYVD